MTTTERVARELALEETPGIHFDGFRTIDEWGTGLNWIVDDVAATIERMV